MTSTVHILSGLPASGKTTFAKSLLAGSDNTVRRVNLDSLRLMLDDNDGHERLSHAHEEVVSAAQDAAILAAVDAGFDVVVDNTHLVSRLPSRYKQLLLTRDVEFRVHDFTGVPLDTCIERDRAREASVGEQVIRDMRARMLAARKGGWRLTDEWMNDRPVVKPYTPPTMPDGLVWAPWAVLVDIDGTLALHSDRGPYDFDKCETDRLNEPVARILHWALVQDAQKPVKIVLLSGRQSEYREHTERWLKANRVPYDELWMRPAGDRRRDDVVKAELFDKHVRDRLDVMFVLDDRDRVVDLWRRIGLTCLQVAYGNF